MELLYKLIYFIALGFVLAVFLFFLVLYTLRKWILRKKTKMRKGNPHYVNVGIFHPYCNAGGGGERVLWCAVRALQEKYDNVKIIIYTGDGDASPNTILNKAKNVFNVSVDEDDTSFIYLKKRHWVEPQMYPYFTILGQSIGSMILGLEALCKFPPDVYLDTMGYAFTLPLFRFLAQCKTGCYIHYPTISTDMLRRVQCRVYAHNNQNYVVKNPFLTWLKLMYYKTFAKLYAYVGCCAQTIMVNSTWTENHIINLFEATFKTHRVYPPCEVNHLKKLQYTGNDNEKIVIMSLGQFRPEKDHPLQLQAMYELRTLLVKDEELWSKLKLVIVGSCRNQEDYVRLKNMQDLSKHLSLENSVEFKVNISYQELIQNFQTAKIGLHTMWNEHFGINVVELMAAGLITVANRSGGPLMDIIETSEGCQTGFLAVDAFEYANCILTILYNTKEQNDSIRNAARSSVDRFSEKEFEINFLRAVGPLFKLDC
ncbi:GDP-Man:Man(3)GlcNAc(2)-PP-Dol alpha-1,2-mannosyltransferase [Condylostylus longicornis]|uniref:GDP-Man:Man(3)GlcNAc(2)-PP-Dol alpha-1,2-mannosyltransferase n=1 Tax=Condylostylus longicornis TaxID=2530218 RepID=UPI00244DC5CE|nr:GDP-Man:Man(3)GlcNAc(2)-PP-Dol alpha-1,2-mannosyltransferase [Condylostylus longicornis]